MGRINKPFTMTIVVLSIIFGSLLLWNIVRSQIIKYAIEKSKPVISVSVSKARQESWQPHLSAVGNVVAINGVAISTQAAGNIVSINFTSGQRVKKDQLLIQIDDRAEQAELLNNTAALKLAEITYLRNKELVQRGAVAKQTFDETAARFQQAQATVKSTETAIAYKHITAPFDGKLGIRNVNLGQYVKPGDSLITLEALNPLYVNFYLPEQYLHDLYVGQPISVTVDPIPSRRFDGKINAISSLIDVQTHNVPIQATIPNEKELLYPGLFARIEVMLPQKKNVITIPQTAVNYTLYGDTVFVLSRSKDKHDKDMFTVWLREVDVGEQRDNKVIITKGLKVGEEVVSSGQLKLTNGQTVVINNSVQP